MEQCKRCGKALKTIASQNVGYGPVCKRKQDEAEAEFLKIQITIEEEIEYQEKVAR